MMTFSGGMPAGTSPCHPSGTSSHLPPASAPVRVPMELQTGEGGKLRKVKIGELGGGTHLEHRSSGGCH